MNQGIKGDELVYGDYRSGYGDASGLPPPAWSKYFRTDFSPPPLSPPPLHPREAAIASVLDAVARLGVVSEYRNYRLPQRPDKPFRLVLGDPGPALYHQGSCPVLDTEIHHARLCSDAKPHIKLCALDAAKQWGIACPVCLEGMARARTEYRRMKPCRIHHGAPTPDDGVVLRWRKDPAGSWYGLILRVGPDQVYCEIAAAEELEPVAF